MNTTSSLNTGSEVFWQTFEVGDKTSRKKSGIEKIRDEIRQHGESILDRSQVLLLREDVPRKSEWDVIANIAIQEGWSFTLFPEGRIRFAKF